MQIQQAQLGRGAAAVPSPSVPGPLVPARPALLQPRRPLLPCRASADDGDSTATTPEANGASANAQGSSQPLLLGLAHKERRARLGLHQGRRHMQEAHKPVAAAAALVAFPAWTLGVLGSLLGGCAWLRCSACLLRTLHACLHHACQPARVCSVPLSSVPSPACMRACTQHRLTQQPLQQPILSCLNPRRAALSHLGAHGHRRSHWPVLRGPSALLCREGACAPEGAPGGGGHGRQQGPGQGEKLWAKNQC